HGVAIEYASSTVGKLDLVTIQAVDCAGAIVMPTILIAIGQTRDLIPRASILQRPQQLAKCDLALATDYEVNSRIDSHVRLRRKAGIISANHHVNTGLNRTH